MTFNVGDRVVPNREHPTVEGFYFDRPGTVEYVNDDGIVEVYFDDSDDGRAVPFFPTELNKFH